MVSNFLKNTKSFQIFTWIQNGFKFLHEYKMVSNFQMHTEWIQIFIWIQNGFKSNTEWIQIFTWTQNGFKVSLSLETFYILQNGIKLCKIQKYMIKSLTGYKDSLKAFVIVHVYKDINFPWIQIDFYVCNMT
jgi:hypothetical protein